MSTVAKEVQVIKATKTGEKAEKIRVAAYCRVSTDKDDQLNSFFAQMRYYTDFVRSNDKMVLVDIYADEGITGTELEKRDEMKRLIRDCKHKKIDRVLVKSVTRFARNSLECTMTAFHRTFHTPGFLCCFCRPMYRLLFALVRILLSQVEIISYTWISPSVHLTVTPRPMLPDMQKTPAVVVSILPQEFFIQCPFL